MNPNQAVHQLSWMDGFPKFLLVVTEKIWAFTEGRRGNSLAWESLPITTLRESLRSLSGVM